MSAAPDRWPAPELRVDDWIDGGGHLRPPLRLADLGSGFKLVFCFQHACPGCHSVGFPTLRRLVDALADKGFGFAAVQTVFEDTELNTIERLRDEQLRYGLAIPFGHDPAVDHGPSRLMQDYHTGGTPWFIVIDPSGRLVYSDFSLDAERLIECFARIDTAPGAEAAARLNDMQTPETTNEQGLEPVIPFDNSYARELDGLYVPWQPRPAPAPRLLRLNRELAAELGLDPAAMAGPQGVAILSGNRVPAGAEPLAQAYAGHQFGGYSPQLGDGRALLLGEVIDRNGRRRDIAFKGSGRTPFSRGGDGKAVLGPVLREYLIGEAMQALGIPTTRALAALATGETVMRETPLPGALLVRVAASHLRVGTFQFVAARRDIDLIRKLADYSIARHDPELVGTDDRHLALLRAVGERQAELIARWMGIGFIHGVMNTDNMTISGETIDYGPCAFLEAYDPQTVFSSIDTQGRYAFGNQPAIAQWNLARFAETLLPLIDESPDRAVERATEVINAFPARYQHHALAVMRAKLGLDDGGNSAADQALAEDFLGLLQRRDVDFTLAFRRLGDAAAGHDAPLQALFPAEDPALSDWLVRWRQRSAAAAIDGQAQAAAMARVNPIYIPRNHQVEAALGAAVENDDLAPFERLLAVLQQPFDERSGDAEFAQPAAPEQTAAYRTFCGT